MKTCQKPSEQLFFPIGGHSVTRTELKYENVHKAQTNNPVFDLEQKCQILQDTFFSGIHLSENDFDDAFKEEIEADLSYIHSQESENQIHDDTRLNDEVSLGETMASFQYPKKEKAAGADKVFHRIVVELQ